MKKKMLVSCMIAALICLAFAGCAKKNESGGGDSKHTFTWWLMNGEDSSYYSDYAKNPVIEYLMTKDYLGENGEQTKINLEFQIPPASSQKDNLITMISTGEYTDMIDISMYPGSIVDLYDQGTVQDLTQYVEDYMPNYLAFLNKHPELKQTATNLVDGEKKYLQIYGYHIPDTFDQWCGFEYRRDWIIKYGKNPNDDSAFSGEYTVKNADGTVDNTSWVDNIVFPSGGSDPIYISDWEWMFGIFKTALQQEGIDDGYCLSLSYGGYEGTGMLVSSFGGGGTTWYKNKDKIEFGLTSDNFRTYLTAMNQWYKNGWIDTAFPEHSMDIFYKIDNTKVRQGKVGLWIGTQSELIGKLATEDGYTKDMVVYTARLPINDLYGTDAQKNVEPYCFYQAGLEASPIVITDKAAKKDMVALCSFIDSLYDEKNILVNNYGLNKEEYETTKNELYTRSGLTEGSYTITTDSEGNNIIKHVDKLNADLDLRHACIINRISIGLKGWTDEYQFVEPSWTDTWRHALAEWNAYTNTGMIFPSFISQLSAEDGSVQSKIETNVSEFASKNVPSFVQGTKDPSNEDDWNAYLKAINKYNPDKVTQIYQNLLDTLNK